MNDRIKIRLVMVTDEKAEIREVIIGNEKVKVKVEG